MDNGNVYELFPQAPEVQTEVQRLNEMAATKMAANQAIINDLGRRGVVVDPTSFLAMRVDSIVEALFDGVDRARFEIDFHTRVGQQLDVWLEEADRAKLTAGVSQAASKLVLP